MAGKDVSVRRKFVDHFQIDDAKIIWPNFKGEGSKFNREGDRNFNIRLRPEDAEVLEADGWLVKHKDPREEGDEPMSTIKVSVSYRTYPPNITLIGNITNRTHRLSEDLVGIIDDADIVKADIILRPYSWEVDGNTGIKAYVKTLYVFIREDPLEIRYARIEEGIIDAEIIEEPLAIEG